MELDENEHCMSSFGDCGSHLYFCLILIFLGGWVDESQ
jgi:hypothetical protein